MDRLIDEIVQVKVSDALASAAATSVNTAAVVGVTEKQGAEVQVLYGQDSVKEEYETGTNRVVFLEPSLTTAASGEIELSLGSAVVAKAKVKAGASGSTVRSVLKDLASSFAAEGYTAKASATRLTITSDAYGATAAADGAFSVNWDSTGFSGSPSNTDGEEGADLVAVSKAFFEEAGPGKLVCIPVDADPTASDIADTLEAALTLGRDKNNREIDFYNVIIRLGEGATATGVKNLANALEEWCKTNSKLGHIEVQDRNVGEDAMAALSEKPLTRVAIYFHKEASGKSLAAALVSERCGNDPARGTWAHKTLASITADATSKENLKDAQDLGLNIYAKIAGVDRTYFGTTGSKTAFIDEVVKKDWIKFRTQEAIFNLLGQANNGDGVDYNDNGIQAVAAAVTSIFNTAMDNDHRYVLPDSTDVTVPKYADISAEDKAVRNLPDVSATFSIQASIHTVKTVELQVVA